METLWFILITFMLTMYVILDGFDLGAGILHLLIAKSDEERRTILHAIGPVWDGNEVWLIAAGGALYLAFPLLYASSFSGFYLPLMIVLWLLMLRGLGIEFRHHVHHQMWKVFWDAVFALGSFLLSIFFGAALGNIIRGVPLNAEGYFFEPLWTTFTVVPNAGILDWFTILMGMVALATLTVHGAHFLAMKTDGEIQNRARIIALSMWWVVLLLSGAALAAISIIRPGFWSNYANHQWGYLFLLLGLLSLAGMFYHNRQKQDGRSFLNSSVFIGSMLASTAFGLYPVMLPSSSDPRLSLTLYNTAAQPYGLSVALAWWIFGMVLTTGYFFFVYRMVRGKVHLPNEEEGY
jgi:cytochrome bd ubiquinol oxidase subunit II